MKVWYHNVLDSQRFVVDVPGGTIRVGSGEACDLTLRSPYIDDVAVALRQDGDVRRLSVVGSRGCSVGNGESGDGDMDNEPLAAGVERELFCGDRVQLFPYVLSLDAPADRPAGPREGLREGPSELERRAARLLAAVHLELLAEMPQDDGGGKLWEDDAALLELERQIEELSQLNGLTVAEAPDLVDHVAGEALRGMLVERLIEHDESNTPGGLFTSRRGWSHVLSAAPDSEAEAEALVDRLVDELGVNLAANLSDSMRLVEDDFGDRVEALLPELLPGFRAYLAVREVKKQIKDIVFGYGPLEDLLRMPTVTEIMVVNRDAIYVEKKGKVERSGRRFVSDEVTQAVANRIMQLVGRRVDKSQPLVDARLTDGSRVNAVIPPLAVSGPCLTIRKFPVERLTLDRLVDDDIRSLTPAAREFLRAAVLAKKNLLIAGGTGTGKTTLLNCLSECLGEKERIVTIEDTAELQLKHEHVVRLEARPKNREGGGEVTIRDLVRNALRMRPDRIVVGECRGGEALDMLQAMNTGHDGSLTTLHANTPEDVVRRLDVLVQEAGKSLSTASINSQISSAVDLIVQLTRLPTGERKVTHITEVLPLKRGQTDIETRDLFLMDADTRELAPTGRLPTFIDGLIRDGGMQLERMYP